MKKTEYNLLSSSLPEPHNIMIIDGSLKAEKTDNFFADMEQPVRMYRDRGHLGGALQSSNGGGNGNAYIPGSSSPYFQHPSATTGPSHSQQQQQHSMSNGTTGSEQISIAPYGGAGNRKGAFGSGNNSKRSIIIKNESNFDDNDSPLDDEKFRKQEAFPWVLEDADQRAFTGKLEGGQSAHYVLFVFDEISNAFRAIPVSHWYKFNPKPQYHTLSLEEAEAKMNDKKSGHDYDRWIMHKRAAALGLTDEQINAELISGGRGVKGVGGKKGIGSSNQRYGNDEDDDGIREDWDYEDVFEDDEGTEILKEEDLAEPSNRSTSSTKATMKNVKLSLAGREVKKLVRHLDKGNYYESDEENPYASDNEDDQSDNSDGSGGGKEGTSSSSGGPMLLSSQPRKVEYPVPGTMSVNTLKLKISHSSTSKSSSSPSLQSQSSQQNQNEMKRSSSIESQISSTSAGSTTTTAKRIKKEEDSSNIITEEEIAHYLQTNGPMKTKDLIAKVKRKLAADPANKDIFRAILKNIATMKVVPGQEDKLLELKADYNN